MTRRPHFFAIPVLFAAGAALSSCTTMELGGIDFMGQNSFEEELEGLDNSFPGASETPDMPTGVRSDTEWDESAREMTVLFDGDDSPSMEPSLTDAEFDAQFDAAQAAASEYKKDDPPE